MAGEDVHSLSPCLFSGSLKVACELVLDARVLLTCANTRGETILLASRPRLSLFLQMQPKMNLLRIR